ncbi:MAG TPA: indolepyruvate oxidoreductase subunit beta [Thermoplasmata archaeon]|nr:indolepyruvate oxidoreductase subunit beta [Thermoplasmata archaeon]
MKKVELVLTGVGGQGILLAADLLSKASFKAGKGIWVSEIHGMAQRGGVVTTSIRIGNAPSPSIADGSADVILSMEPLEALRQLKKLRGDGMIVTDPNPVVPFEVTLGKTKYPPLDKVFNELSKHSKRLVKVDTLQLAKKAGSTITRNVVLLGALAGVKVLPFDRSFLVQTIEERFPPGLVEQNMKAFELGVGAVNESSC